MVDLRTLRNTGALPDDVLLRAEAEYMHAYAMIRRTSAAESAVLRRSLGEAIALIQKELHIRRLQSGGDPESRSRSVT